VESERIPVPDEEPLALEMRHFLDCVTTGRAPRTDGASSLAVLRVLEACQRSLERGGTPVRLAVDAAYFVHPTATVDPGAVIGAGTRIWHYTHVSDGATIGRDATLGQNVFVARDVVIGNNVKIQNNVSVYEGVTLEDDVFCGPSMVFTNVVNPRSHVSRKTEFRPTLVRRGGTVGANATVLCGHVVGRYAFVGAGAVVLDDVPDYGLVVGNPARLVGWICACGVRLPLRVDAGDESDACPKCGARYARHGQQVTPLP
jgi:UDP-2-acetamido-3-amino-2,3-dideoxy-glucuronate N-acetyltransferase